MKIQITNVGNPGPFNLVMMNDRLMTVEVVDGTLVVSPVGPGPTPVPKDFGGLRPHLQGFGSGATASEPVLTPNVGGRHPNAQVFLVNTLQDNRNAPTLISPGIYRSSFRRAVEADVPRYVCFERAGVINVNRALGPITQYHPHLTIAAQTAPDPGVTIRGQVQFSSHDFFVQHLRIRFGLWGNLGQADSIPVLVGSNGLQQDTYNGCFDHTSISFANGYMSLAASDFTGQRPNPWDINFSDGLITYGLARNWQWGGFGGSVWPQANGQATWARTAHVHMSHRAPIGSCKVQIIKVLTYGSGPTNDWVTHALQCVGQNHTDEDPRYKTEAVLEGGKFISSHGTGSGDTAGSNADRPTFVGWMFNDGTVYGRGDRVWLHANVGPGILGPEIAQQWPAIHFLEHFQGDGGLTKSFTVEQLGMTAPPAWHVDMQFQQQPGDDLEVQLEKTAGAYPAWRDDVDKKAVEQMLAGAAGDLSKMGSRIQTPEELGVPLTLTPKTRQLSVPANPNEVVDQYGRTRIDQWLEEYALEAERR